MEKNSSRKVLVIEVDHISQELKTFLEINFSDANVTIIENASHKDNIEIVMKEFFQGNYTDIVFQSVFVRYSWNLMVRLLSNLTYHPLKQPTNFHSLSQEALVKSLNKIEGVGTLKSAIVTTSNYAVYEYDFFGNWQRSKIKFNEYDATFRLVDPEEKSIKEPWSKQS